jgi:hypothetical protein
MAFLRRWRALLEDVHTLSVLAQLRFGHWRGILEGVSPRFGRHSFD